MIRDFATIYPGCFFPGLGNLTIGHNFWLGANSIIDSQGGTTVGNNVGIGAYRQLWPRDRAWNARIRSVIPASSIARFEGGRIVHA